MRTPTAEACRFEGASLSYEELNARANGAAHALVEAGAGPEIPVAVCMDRSMELVVSLLAILKCGACYVPIETGYPLARQCWMLSDCRAQVLVARSTQPLAETAGSVRVLNPDRISQRVEACPPNNRIHPCQAAYMLYTSGSTGTPKGAINTHRGIRNRLVWMQRQFGLTSDDRVLQKTPFGFDVSVWEFFWPLMYGACLVIASPDGHLDPAYLAGTIHRERVTTLHFVPSLLKLFLDELKQRPFCDSLRRVICSGEQLPAALRDRYRDVIRAPLYNLYGPTEAAIDVTSFDCSVDTEPVVSIGRPIDNVRIYILNAFLDPVPIGAPGEVFIAGAGLGRGYANRPDITAERFLPDPYTENAGECMYRTGDVARYREGGDIEFLGRLDQQVKINGQRVELGEIESALLRSDKVKQAAVVVQSQGRGVNRLIAYLVPAKLGINPEELRREIAGELPRHMVPHRFVRVSRIPLTSSGKIDRKQLAQLAEEPEQPIEELLEMVSSLSNNEAAQLLAAMTGGPNAGAAHRYEQS